MSINIRKLVLPLVTIFVLSSCTTTSPVRYCSDNDDLCRDKFYLPEENVKHTLYLVGDAGEPHEPEGNIVLNTLKRLVDNEDENSTVVFLGDNIYPAGLPAVNDENRAEAEMAINKQLYSIKDFKGKAYFIPGNHDWNRFAPGGREAVLRQEQYVQKYFEENEGPEVKWIPSDGCSGPTVKKGGKDLKFIFIDSQWWLQDWDSEENMNENCDHVTRYSFMEELEEKLVKYRNDQVVLLLHHPLYSNGYHGGRFGLRSHLFPLTKIKDWLYLPLPVIGSIYPAYRKTNGSTQDIPHVRYNELKQGIEAILRKHQMRDVIFASGHEHNLQYFEVDDNHFIVSGSGSKRTYVGQGGDSEFTSASFGFAKITMYESGETWLEFYVQGTEDIADYPVYRKMITSAAPGKLYDKDVLEKPNTRVPDEITVSASQQYKANAFKRFMLGDQYREAWQTEVNVPTLDLTEAFGGVYPKKKGGGFASNTMRLQSLSTDKEYALRSVNKDARGPFSETIRKLKIADIIQDQISAIHPFSATVVASLAEEAGIYHTNPSFVYLKHQDHLDNFNELFKEDIYLLEERPNGDWSEQSSFGNSSEIMGYNDLLKKKRKSSDHVVDQEWVLKSRVFDIWIHDWDRHDDQWRWASFDQDSITLYRPIPRDRDQAFYKFKGFIPWYTASFVVKKFVTMKDDLKTAHWQSFNARYFDRDFLNQMDRADWVEAAAHLKENMTDEIIEKAFTENWNEELMNQDGHDIIRKLKARRDNLEEIIFNLYDYLSLEVDVVGTSGRDKFEIRQIDDKLHVTTWDIRKDGSIKRKMYNRIFDPKETKRINVYGLDDDDIFEISKSNSSKIKVRIIGGEDDDKVVEIDGSDKKQKNVHIYDQPDGLTLEAVAKDHRDDDYFINEYDRFGHKYDLNTPTIGFALFPDNPLLIRLGYSTEKHGWRKAPYKNNQKFGVGISPSIEEFNATYYGHFIDVLGKIDLGIDVDLFEPRVVNVFSFGQSGDLIDLDDRMFNQVKVRDLSASVLFKQNFWNDRLTIGAGPFIRNQKAERDEERVTGLLEELPDYTFESLTTVGGRFMLELDALTYEQKRPFSGLYFSFNGSVNDIVGEAGEDLNSEEAEASIRYFIGEKFDEDTDLVLGFGAAAGRQWGSVPIYNTLAIGRENFLRGYRLNRYRGDRYLAFNADLNFKIFYWDNSVLPMDVGVNGGYDLGKIKGQRAEDLSSDWISATSFGLFLSPLRYVTINPFMTITEDGNTFSFTFGVQL